MDKNTRLVEFITNDVLRKNQRDPLIQKLDIYCMNNDRRDINYFLWILSDMFHGEWNDVPLSVWKRAAQKIKTFWNKRIPPMTATDRRNLDTANNIISGRTYYMVHDLEKQKGKGIVIFWSNGAEAWAIDRWKTRDANKGKEVRLDANEVILPMSESTFNRIRYRLAMLPLYMGSIEAKTRGQVSWQTGDDAWKFGQFLGRMKEEEGKQKNWHKKWDRY